MKCVGLVLTVRKKTCWENLLYNVRTLKRSQLIIFTSQHPSNLLLVNFVSASLSSAPTFYQAWYFRFSESPDVIELNLSAMMFAAYFSTDFTSKHTNTSPKATHICFQPRYAPWWPLLELKNDENLITSRSH